MGLKNHCIGEVRSTPFLAAALAHPMYVYEWPRWFGVSSRLISQQKSAASLAEPLSSPAFSSPRSAGMTMYPKARKKILCESGSPVSQYRVLLIIEMPVQWYLGNEGDY